ncbi:MAG: DUF547 domain-containing protein [Verrucomicrobiota bacterium]
MREHVSPRGRVDYVSLKSNPEQLDAFYAQIATYSPDSHPQFFPDREDRLAYWINAYNATVLRTVIEHYPIESVADVETPFYLPDKSGFFLLQRLTYGGAATSLYFLENNVIRKRFNDPRIHFALNCASIGCPELPRTPFLPKTLDKQLDFETRKFVNDPRQVRFDPKTNTLWLSSIFKWFRSDFTRSPGKDEPVDLANYVRHYLHPAKRAQLDSLGPDPKIGFLAYDWSLNAESQSRARSGEN